MSRSIRYAVVLLVFLTLATSAWPAGAAPVLAGSFVVDTDSDDHDGDLGNGVCDTSGGACTLRAAIEEANALGGGYTITFAYPMDISLSPQGGEMAIGTQIRLDASGVWDTANDEPGVSINGVNLGSVCIAVYDASNVEIYGLDIHNCGMAIAIYSSYNTVGGPLAGQRNVLYNNDASLGGGCGVYLGTSGAHHNVIQGNWIGLTPAGDTTAPNGIGVNIGGGAHDNTIGGDTAHGNYISGNIEYGVRIEGSGTTGNRLGGNTIGLTAVGSHAAGNGTAGVRISGSDGNQIGGSGLPGNIIVYSALAGVHITDSQNNRVEGNCIALNSGDGVYVSGATATGNSILTNLIYDNDQRGIELADGGNHELAAPIIAAADASGASGTACGGCTVEVFSDSADEGETYHGSTVADGSGNWSYSGPLSGPNVTATATNTGGDTSEFSAPFALGGKYKVYLPCICRNH